MTQGTSRRPSLSRLACLSLAAAFLATQGCGPAQPDSPTEPTEATQSLLANPRIASAAQQASDHLRSLRSSLRLSAEHDFALRSAVQDERGRLYLRYDQTFAGKKVWASDAIVEILADSKTGSLVSDLKADIQVPTTPRLSEAQALSIVHSDLRPQGPYANAPEIELLIYPELGERTRGERLRGPHGELNAEDIERHVVGYHLAYHVRAALHNGDAETKARDYMIDALSGAILTQWDSLYTASATGSGSSQYSGMVQITAESVMGGTFELRDTSRAMNIATYDMKHGSTGTGTIYTDADNTWGDGKNYVKGGPTGDDNGQTAAVDAHFGSERTFDYFMNVHGRKGIDGAGKATYSRVHFATSFDNAFWDDACFCMTYGDGNAFTVLTSLDVAGHEMAHGVTANTAKLVYRGESGGLNESMSDIHGTMVEFYARGGGGTTIGDTGGNFLIGDQLSASPLRYMIKPSKDGKSPDAWKNNLGSLDVHFSSGPMNRAFYFLAQGASSMNTDESYSTYLPSGMTGLGNDKAARIAYRALATKMTSNTNYAGARTAFLAAATDLYGAASPEFEAVENAFGGINVGKPHGGGGGSDVTPPSVTVTKPGPLAFLKGTATVSATATDDVGVTKVEYYVGPTLVATSTTTPFDASFDSTKTKNGVYFFTSKAYDMAGNVGTSPAVLMFIAN